MLNRFLDRIEYDSYEDFKQNYKLNIPEHFNFGYDIVDEWARQDENKPALVWCDDDANEKRFTFGDIKRMSDKAANMLKNMGIRKGDAVMLMLRQRPEVWFMMVGLHKLGAICIPATFSLRPRISFTAATLRRSKWGSARWTTTKCSGILGSPLANAQRFKTWALWERKSRSGPLTCAKNWSRQARRGRANTAMKK